MPSISQTTYFSFYNYLIYQKIMLFYNKLGIAKYLAG